MLMQADFDLNSAQIYTESLKEVLKKTMLDQEVMFRKQVEELHRLYTIQKTQMENLSWKEFDRYNSRKASTQSTLIPSTNLGRYKPFAKETTFSSIPMEDSTQARSHVLFEGHQGMYSKLWQKPLDLQLSADQYTSHVDPELKLSLSTGEDNWRKRSAKRIWFSKKAHSSTHDIIDLEESSEGISNEDEKHAPSLSFAALTNHFGGKHESDSVLSDLVISSCVKKDLPYEIADSHPLLDDSKCCQEMNSFKKGFNNCHVGVPSTNPSTKMQLPTSFKAANVDLNKVQLDDSSSYSNDLVVAHPSTASSPHVFIEQVGRVQDTCVSMSRRKENNNCSNETSDMFHQDDAVNSPLIDFNSKSKRTEIWARNSKFDGGGGSEVGLSGVEAISRAPPGLRGDLGSNSSDPKNENFRFMSELSSDILGDSNYTCLANGQINFEKSKVENIILSGSEQSQVTVQGGCGNMSPASCKSHCNVENDSSSIKTMQSGIEKGSSNLSTFDQFSGTDVVCQVAETLSGNQDQGSSDSSESKHGCLNKKGESSEPDVLIRMAAESLVHFSLEISSGNQDCCTGAGLNEMRNEEREQPQYSSDSFELMTLNLKECSADDYSVSSKPFEVNDKETKDFSCKLRRGRRLKDFQKDILPGLASLARHEIREDINILEGVLRSREYRKIRARMGDGQSWCAPVRSRRSRINYNGRKKL
ncbi:hypothetical protein CMV_006289 [Castanea mollissima]|uniref:Uncharacterized protein n=1 Tax=Castanea mollissima TaxID=60419 RepID=A0A8J4RPF7_9ROSI|nr:hypothetical protein CMV_006289 [Castanea mollissima]